jgi:hypothetical protein
MRNRRLVIAIWIGALLIAVGSWPVIAQEPTYLSLATPATNLSTGQEYEVSIQIENVPELWMANLEIQYDPEMIFVLGTRAGSPVQLGSFFTPGASIEIRNLVQNDLLLYTASQLAPADLLQGSGVLGTFRIYPLAPGTTTLTFRQAELFTVTFTGEGEERAGTDSSPVPFTSILLELTISGDPVEPPSEATATPEPTATPDNFSAAVVPTREPTLANVTRPPGSDSATTTPDQGPLPTPALLSPPEIEDEESTSGVLVPLIVTLVVLVAAGIVFLLVAQRRQTRK